MSIGERIRKRREELGLSVDDVARRLGKHRATIYRYESSEIEKLPTTVLEQLATVLLTTPAELMGWEDTLPANATPVDLARLKRIPILGRIAAGRPVMAVENIEGYTYTDLNGGAEYFALRVKGDSMNAARINDGDVVIVRRQDVVDNGQIAVVLIDGEDATLKRFRQDGRTITLSPQSTNPTHQPIVLDASSNECNVLGLVVRVEFAPV